MAHALRFRDKCLMKEVLHGETDVVVPTFKRVQASSDIIAFVDEHGTCSEWLCGV